MTNEGDAKENALHEVLWLVATAVRDACYSAALSAYEDASIDGLCHDGARECALAAMRELDYSSIVSKAISDLPPD
ncbi:MAG: acetyltransferase [Candidatus Promineifilaceae bacterium]|jgi:hypothetical protein